MGVSRSLTVVDEGEGGVKNHLKSLSNVGCAASSCIEKTTMEKYMTIFVHQNVLALTLLFAVKIF